MGLVPSPRRTDGLLGTALSAGRAALRPGEGGIRSVFGAVLVCCACGETAYVGARALRSVCCAVSWLRVDDEEARLLLRHSDGDCVTIGTDVAGLGSGVARGGAPLRGAGTALPNKSRRGMSIGAVSDGGLNVISVDDGEVTEIEAVPVLPGPLPCPSCATSRALRVLRRRSRRKRLLDGGDVDTPSIPSPIGSAAVGRSGAISV